MWVVKISEWSRSEFQNLGEKVRGLGRGRGVVFKGLGSWGTGLPERLGQWVLPGERRWLEQKPGGTRCLTSGDLAGVCKGHLGASLIVKWR